jgi:hypothetical protein
VNLVSSFTAKFARDRILFISGALFARLELLATLAVTSQTIREMILPFGRRSAAKLSRLFCHKNFFGEARIPSNLPIRF